MAKCTINVSTTKSFWNCGYREKVPAVERLFIYLYLLSSHLYYRGVHRQVLELTPSAHNSFFKRVISAVYFCYCCPRALRPRPDRPFKRMIGPPARCWSLLQAGLRSPKLLRVVLAFEANGWWSMWWMAFMRAEYRWLKDRQLARWKREDRTRYITAPPPVPLIHFHVRFFFSFFLTHQSGLFSTLPSLLRFS